MADANRCLRFTAALIASLLFGLVNSARAEADFDFYLLALAWSPTFCSGSERYDNRAQCSQERDFIVHGLWPQYEKGYPEDCKTDEPDFVPSSIVRRMSDIMPGGGLVGGQWRKHGTCSGLSQSDYFDLVHDAYDTIQIPEEFDDPEERQYISARAAEAAFLKANPGMSANGLIVTCKSSKLDEIRICLTKDINFRRCAEIDRNECRQNRLLVPASGNDR